MESEQISLLSSETEKNKPEDTFLSFFSLFQQELSQEHDQRFESAAFLDWSKLKKKEIFRTLGDTSFACCSAFVRCSDARECLHQTDIYYNHCYYRENLEAGRIFYGKNKNI